MSDLITARALLELADVEAIVLESYLDGGNVWTWSIGVTDASGHKVARYRDRPSTLEHAVEIYVWLVRTRYAPAVLKAFKNFPLTEAQFAAALMFHYNTGRIATTDWVQDVLEGDMHRARHFLESHYLNDGALASRRKREAALFFDGVWAAKATVTLYHVLKPSHHPDFRHPSKVDIRPELAKALAG